MDPVDPDPEHCLEVPGYENVRRLEITVHQMLLGVKVMQSLAHTSGTHAQC